jgi:hypothetical protein
MDNRTIRESERLRVVDLVRAGKVRVGLFPPQYTKDEKRRHSTFQA